jgi:hypothetical protein
VQIRRIRYNLCGHNTSLNIVCVATLGGGAREGGMEGGSERARESRGTNIFTNSYSSAAFHIFLPQGQYTPSDKISFRFDL